MVDLTQHTGIEQPTARRILKSLISEGLVMQRPGDHRYFLGPVFFNLAFLVRLGSILNLFEPFLIRIAKATHDAVFFVVTCFFDSRTTQLGFERLAIRAGEISQSRESTRSPGAYLAEKDRIEENGFSSYDCYKNQHRSLRDRIPCVSSSFSSTGATKSKHCAVRTRSYVGAGSIQR